MVKDYHACNSHSARFCPVSLGKSKFVCSKHGNVPRRNTHGTLSKRIQNYLARLHANCLFYDRHPRIPLYRVVCEGSYPRRLSGYDFGCMLTQARLGSLEGGIDFLMKCGFKKDAAGEFLLMAPEDVAAEVLNAAGSEINTALTNPFFGVL